MSLLRKSKRLEIREGASHGKAPSGFFSWLGAVLQSRVLCFAVSAMAVVEMHTKAATKDARYNPQILARILNRRGGVSKGF